MEDEFEGEPPAELRYQENGSTEFAQCGWCPHASGSHRFSYCIEGKCSLHKSYGPTVRWDTPCLLKDASKNELEAIVANHKYSIDAEEQSIKRHKERIAILKSLSKKAPKRPPLPDDRPHDYFNTGDEVAIYWRDQSKWGFGKVVPGYRHQDGCVSFIATVDGKTSESGCGMGVPTVMLAEDFRFFRENPDVYEIWCQKAYNRKYNGEMLTPPPIGDSEEKQ